MEYSFSSFCIPHRWCAHHFPLALAHRLFRPLLVRLWTLFCLESNFQDSFDFWLVKPGANCKVWLSQLCLCLMRQVLPDIFTEKQSTTQSRKSTADSDRSLKFWRKMRKKLRNCIGIISFVLFICQFSLAEQHTDCSELLKGQFLCPLPDIDPETQQPRNCDKDSKKAKIQCQAAPGIICK